MASGFLYPGYSQINQAMSELGAQGAPTHVLSPLINNYPLGFLFIFFGIAVSKTFHESKLAIFTGLLIIIHGIASFCTGYFSCDVGCRLESPSTSQTIHNYSGLVMFASIFLASAIWSYLGRKLLNSLPFTLFSIFCSLVALVTLPLMGNALEAGHFFGLYQRINYGASVVWIAGLALLMLKRY
ncbi:uncharacterized protein DUF998 [Pseudomonas duriflava]|uniref:Uncharacterized protein DUF998 n=2 Tax=Pseudomonas duriflava TaxID=459528 RepID=A0A562Q8S0_9PSED|nr:uncharacterized protein DUF998 [Pseudomonas duriflava]